MPTAHRLYRKPNTLVAIAPITISVPSFMYMEDPASGAPPPGPAPSAAPSAVPGATAAAVVGGRGASGAGAVGAEGRGYGTCGGDGSLNGSGGNADAVG